MRKWFVSILPVLLMVGAILALVFSVSADFFDPGI